MAAATQLLAHTDALILDLRATFGGDPDMVALVCGYLFDEPTHLNSMYERDGERIRQSWSPAYVPGPRFGGRKPVYVLTSAATFSGGEGLSYDLQQQGRATVVGERTRGGAHPRIGVRVHPHLELTIPVARPIHPVSGTNWEGCGVAPDVEVPAGEAFEVAYKTALEAVRHWNPHSPAAAEAPQLAEPAR
jgi:C-terminal processing protease CtpA/Prc